MMVFIQTKKKQCILKISVLNMGHVFPLIMVANPTTACITEVPTQSVPT
jgi:hypothetical protein